MIGFARLLIGNKVLTNLTFILVLAMGVLAYWSLPRQQDPTINFNWIVITVAWPGSSALDVESRITDPIEEAIQRVDDLDFVSSYSREGLASILVRFEDIPSQVFERRLGDLRREVNTAESEFPDEATDPIFIEITSSNAFPAATLALVGSGDDDSLREQAVLIEKELERRERIDRIDTQGMADPEIRIEFDATRIAALGLSPSDVATTVQTYFQDLAAGELDVAGSSWLVRLKGKSTDAFDLNRFPILGRDGSVRIGDVARVTRTQAERSELVRYEGKPSVLLAVMKAEGANTLELVDEVKDYITTRNALEAVTGTRLVLIDDQTIPTRKALNIMQNNALIGLMLVLVVAWIFLGFKIAALTAIGIPFILAGTFWILQGMDQTLNVTVLLGVVIALGMLVDDAVVVVEAIYYRIERGLTGMEAVLDALTETAAPVTAAVLTTVAAFMPLMLLPGILGKFMMVIPLVVSVALLISLVEAFWMLPSHVLGSGMKLDHGGKMQQFRTRLNRGIRHLYTHLLIRALRRPIATLAISVVALIGAVGLLASGQIRADFFASDPIRVFYVNVETEPGAKLERTLDLTLEIEKAVRANLAADEARGIVAYAGQQFTETEPLRGSHRGQVLVGLQPEGREVSDIVDGMREAVLAVPGPSRVTFLELAGGPPAAKPISIKVRGSEFGELRAAADEIRSILQNTAGVKDITDDAQDGRFALQLTLDPDQVARSGLVPAYIARNIRILVDGEIVESVQDQGETVDIRVVAADGQFSSPTQLLGVQLPTATGDMISLSELVDVDRSPALGTIRHYNFRRTITVEADIDSEITDTVTANQSVMEAWAQLQASYPNVNLDFSGELDDIQESLDSIGILFLFGIGVMYLILGTQFQSYGQPLLILVTVPLAFTGVVLGLFVTGNPLSLYTLYGVVALSGIAVNSAIVLISAANDRLMAGMSLKHATLYAGRRRVVPIVITVMTTIAGLFSLAAGLGGSSLIWGPVATAIVWGLGFSSVLTLFVVPLLYFLTGKKREIRLNPSP
ncbi:MAG: efflux RND transporter permease subunit [Gammaproteobacteria bacterium]|nr:efflux RND transporter permease subunit [Gammaproteobacteria bacterium]